MDGFSVYKIHVALRAHFTTEKYNVFETQGRTKVKIESFIKRSDSKLFDMLAAKLKKEREVVNFFVSNYAFGNTGMVWSYTDGIENLERWNSIQDSVTWHIKNDLDKIVQEVKLKKSDKRSIFHFTSDGKPVILDLWLRGDLLPHTMVILDKAVGYYDSWVSSPMGSVIKEKLLMLNKLTKFVKVPEDKLQVLLRDFVEELRQNTKQA